jgi:hypothetical protein
MTLPRASAPRCRTQRLFASASSRCRDPVSSIFTIFFPFGSVIAYGSKSGYPGLLNRRPFCRYFGGRSSRGNSLPAYWWFLGSRGQ